MTHKCMQAGERRAGVLPQRPKMKKQGSMRERPESYLFIDLEQGRRRFTQTCRPQSRTGQKLTDLCFHVRDKQKIMVKL